MRFSVFWVSLLQTEGPTPEPVSHVCYGDNNRSIGSQKWPEECCHEALQCMLKHVRETSSRNIMLCNRTLFFHFLILWFLIIFRVIYYNNIGFKAVMHDSKVSPKTHCSNMFTIWRLLLIISFILKTVLTRSLKTCDLSPDFINSQHGLLVKEFMYMWKATYSVYKVEN